MLNKNQYELLSTHFPAWDKLTEEQRHLIINNSSLISVKKIHLFKIQQLAVPVF